MSLRRIGELALKAFGLLLVLAGVSTAFAIRFADRGPNPLLFTLIVLVIFAYGPAALGMMLLMEAEAIHRPRLYSRHTRTYRAGAMMMIAGFAFSLYACYVALGRSVPFLITIIVALFMLAFLQARYYLDWSTQKAWARAPRTTWLDWFDRIFITGGVGFLGLVFLVITHGAVGFPAFSGRGGKSGGGGASGGW